MTDRPARLLDPICGMAVDVAEAEADGLLLEYEGRTYAFCRPACKRTFLEDPAAHAARADSTDAVAAPSHELAALPPIDEGMRRWYESCSCCLGDTYPEIKAQLDAERAAAAQPPVGAGICEVADADAAPTPASEAVPAAPVVSAT